LVIHEVSVEFFTRNSSNYDLTMTNKVDYSNTL